MAVSGDVIATLEGLLAHLELDDADELTDWLEDQLWDPVAAFQVRVDSGTFQVDGSSASLMNLDGYTIELTYPFDIQQFHDEVGAAVAHFDAHAGAAVVVGRPLGDLLDEDDATAELADWAGVAVENLSSVLGGRWDPADKLPQVSSTGTIYGWWVRHAEPAVALGVGGLEVFVEAVSRDDGEIYMGVEHPDAHLRLRSNTSVVEAGARAWLASFAAAIDQAGGSASTRSR